MQPAFRWPCIRGCKSDIVPDTALEEMSPLTEMGYHVGETSKLNAWERRRILRHEADD